MKNLGYKKYFAQGGDWGSAVTTALGTQDPDCEAIHLNMAVVSPDILLLMTIALIFCDLIMFLSNATQLSFFSIP